MITLIAVVLGMLSVAPGLGIVLAILGLPVLARTAGVVRAREAQGIPTPPAKRILLFLGSFLTAIVIAVVIGVASIGTFCAVCVGLYEGRGRSGFDEESATWIAIFAALLTTVGAIFLIVKWIRSRWRRDTQER